MSLADRDSRPRARAGSQGCFIAAIALFLLCALSVCCVGSVTLLLPRTDRVVSLPEIAPVERLIVAPRAGGTLRLPGNLPPTLDPATVQDVTSAEYIVHLFSGLVSLNAELDVVPDLATHWDVLEDGRVYLFHLREDAVFRDGTPITAEDVQYSLERACSPELGSPVALDYLGDIVGAEALFRGEAEYLSGLEVIDPHTLRIDIDAPKAYFLAKLTYPTAYVVDHRQIEREGERWMLQPNGSGPFMLTDLSRDRIVLQRNERYYGDLPALERVIFELGGGLPITMYENDQLDITWVPANELDRVLDPHHPLSRDVQIASELSTQYLAMHAGQPPFDDPAVRRAILHAIDRDLLAELVLNNSVEAARGILPPALIPAGDDPATEIMVYDPALAREMLASSSYAGDAMPPLVLTIVGTSGHLGGVPRAVVAMLEENLGLEVLVEQVEWGDFLQDLNRERYGMFLSGWIADYPDPQNFLDLLFHSASGQNHTGYRNAEVDALLEQARIEPDEDRRAALYQEAELLILGDAPWVPLAHGVSYSLVKPWVQGYEASSGLFPWLREIHLTER
jgi:oligopeptide transport system substrate-binding protein